MDIHIFDLDDAMRFEPVTKTAAIRIFSSWAKGDDVRFPLQESPLYVRINTYVFDDNERNPPFKRNVGPKSIAETLAETIIRDFASIKDNIDALLVHCTYGQNRSPAVAMALNDLFHLGHDTDDLKLQYPEYNRTVYETLMHTGQRLAL